MRAAKLFYAIGIALFLFIVSSTGVERIAGVLSGINPVLFLAALAFALPLLLLKAVKQNVLMHAFGARMPLQGSVKIWLIGYFLSVITPGRSGDFLRSLYLSKQTGVASGKCLTAVAVERALDLFCLFVLGIAGLAVLSMQFGVAQSAIASLALLFAGFCAAMLLLSRKKAVAFLARPLFNALAPEKWKGRLSAAFRLFYEGLFVYRKKKGSVALALLLTVLNWAASIGQYYIVALALGMQVQPLFLVVAMPAVLLAEALPISISGIGTRDAAAVLLLSFGGVQPASAVGFSITVLALNLVIALFGLLFFQKNKIPL